MKVRLQLFGTPGKNSASSDRAGFVVLSMTTRVSPIAFLPIRATVSGLRT
jgi:hypothetical protein